MSKIPLVFLLLAFLSLSSASSLVKKIGPSSNSVGDENDDYSCVYTIYVRTGSVWKGGTDSIISVTLLGADGYGVQITDIESWGGQMGDGYNYFERGNLDIFSGRGPCMASTPCWLNLTSDGSGAHHGWYCNYVEVTTTGPHLGCSQQLFTVEQWLATDTSPYKLYSTVDNCYSQAGGSGHESRRIKMHRAHVDG
ncbi:hypothetical protein LUZ60_001184 [Juncus effusus]|nr:hypothetical protein LUZ60_001184 [Juncus effusus]